MPNGNLSQAADATRATLTCYLLMHVILEILIIFVVAVAGLGTRFAFTDLFGSRGLVDLFEGESENQHENRS